MSISSALKKTVSAIVGFASGVTRASLGLGPGQTPKEQDPENKNLGDNSASNQTLGMIYQKLVTARQEELSRRFDDKDAEYKRRKIEDDRNTEIIKALTIKRKPTKRAPTPSKPEPAKPEPAKPEPAKPAPAKPAPAKPEVTKPTPSKVTEPVVTKPSAPPSKVTEPVVTKPTAPPSRVTEPVVTKPTAPPSKPPTTTKVETPQLPKPSAEKVAPSIPKPAAPAGKGIAGVVSAGAGTIAIITSALVASGITNAYAQKAILANVGKESGFKPRDENLAAYAKTSNDRIREVFTKRASKYTDEELNQIKKDPYKLAEMMYGKDTDVGKSMGNTQEGDGFKYRGRGSIQLTFKNNYSAYSKAAGVDLVANPELANQPDIDAKIVTAFVKKGVGSKLNDFTDQQTANRAVTQAIGGRKLNLDVGIGAGILAKVEEFSAVLVGDISTGSKIDQASKENKDLKDSSATQNKTNVNNIISQSTKEPDIVVRGKVDDRSPYDKKK
jgi:predicted chitinase